MQSNDNINMKKLYQQLWNKDFEEWSNCSVKIMIIKLCQRKEIKLIMTNHAAVIKKTK